MLRISSSPFLNRWQGQIKSIAVVIVNFVKKEKFILELKLSQRDARQGKGIRLNSIDDLDLID